MSNERNEELVVKSELQKVTVGLGKVASAAEKAVAGVVEVVTSQLEDLSEKITVKTVALNDLEQSFTSRKEEIAAETKEIESKAKAERQERRRAEQVGRDLDIKEDENAAVKALLSKRGEVAVADGTVENLQTELEEVKIGNEAQVNSAVEAAKKECAASKAAALKTAELENKAQNAKKDADLDAAAAKIELLQDQLDSANNQIAELRKAMTEMITKQSAPTINVGQK